MRRGYARPMQERDTHNPDIATPSALEMPRFRLAAGDRFPDFVLPDQLEKARHFSERARGCGLAIVLDPDAAAIAGLSALAAACDAAGLDRMAIAASSGFDPGFPLLADSAGKIRAGLREMSGHPGSTPLVGAGFRPYPFDNSG